MRSAVGILEDSDYVPRSIALAPGDLLVLYTDGITEAENAQKALFGTKRLEEAILEMRGEPARNVVEHVIKRVTAFAEAPCNPTISHALRSFVRKRVIARAQRPVERFNIRYRVRLALMRMSNPDH